jgi:hypothetical protein
MKNKEDISTGIPIYTWALLSFSMLLVIASISVLAYFTKTLIIFLIGIMVSFLFSGYYRFVQIKEKVLITGEKKWFGLKTSKIKIYPLSAILDLEYHSQTMLSIIGLNEIELIITLEGHQQPVLFTFRGRVKQIREIIQAFEEKKNL